MILASDVVGQTDKYGTALVLGQLITVTGWLVIAAGAMGAMASMNNVLFAAVSLAVGTALGLVTIASGQLIRAAVDVANNSAGLLALEKAKWDESHG